MKATQPASEHSDRPQPGNANPALSHARKRVGLQLAGAFSFIALASWVSLAAQPASSSSAKKPASRPANSVQLHVSHQTSTAATNTPAPAADTEAAASVAPDQSNNESSSNTNVTVNGQSVPVPANGSISKVINNPDGSSVQLDINNSQTSTGNETNISSTVTTTSVISSNSNVEETSP